MRKGRQRVGLARKGRKRKPKKVGIKKGRRITMTKEARKQKAVTLDRLLREGIIWFLDSGKEIETDEEGSHPTEPDISPEGENEDSEYPIDQWDEEWSPWCEDSEALAIREFLRRRLDLTTTAPSEKRELIKKILNCSDTQQALEIAWTVADKAFREHLLKLLAEYRFNYAHEPWVSGELVQPDVIVNRQWNGKKWCFEIVVPDYYPTLADPEGYKKLWEDTLKSFTELLIEKIREFFEASNWEEAEQNLRKKVEDKSWTEIAFAWDWWKKQTKKSLKTKEYPKTPKTYRNLVSIICRHRYIYLRFFNKCLLFSHFFKLKD